MRIYLSYASHNKPLIRALIDKMPKALSQWISDSNEPFWGEDLDIYIQAAIQNSDYFILFIDEATFRSAWVRREIEFALQIEKTSGRTALLPVALGRPTWPESLVSDLSTRRYLLLDNNSEDSISKLANDLTNELFARISRDLDTSSSQVAQLQRSLAEIEPSANRLFSPDGDSKHQLILLCPVCQQEYTHHKETVEYQRPDGEDGKSIAVTIHPRAICTVQSSIANPSPRRDAVEVKFTCESGHEFSLLLVQHKGQTLVYTTSTGETSS